MGAHQPVCSRCGGPRTPYKRCATCRRKDYHANPVKYINLVKKTRSTYRDRVVKHYRESCACCGESTVEFLTLVKRTGDGFVGLRANPWCITVTGGFPKDVFLVCRNCSHTLRYTGSCPHGNKIHCDITKEMT